MQHAVHQVGLPMNVWEKKGVQIEREEVECKEVAKEWGNGEMEK